MSAPETNAIQRAAAATTVEATVDQCYAVVLDLERYPEWAVGIDRVSVESRDEQGRPVNVLYEVEGLGRRASYTLGYDLSDAPRVVAWTLVSGNLTRGIEGRYVFTPSEDGEADAPSTHVQYELAIDLAVPLPGFVKRRAEDKIVDAALERFKQRVESISA